MVKLIVIFVASIVGAILYRLGGTSKGTKWRDIGVPFVFLGLFYYLHPAKFPTFLLSYSLTFLLMLGSLTTYRYFLPKPPDGNYKWYHYFLHGFFIGLASLPLLTYIPIVNILIRTFALSILVSVWSIITKWDVLEEGGRGFWIIVTTPILII